MTTYAERLKRALEYREVSQSLLARQVGVKPQAIQYLVTKGTGSKHSAAIARELHISLNWLTDGCGPMLPTSNVIGIADGEPLRYADNVRPAPAPKQLYPIVSWAHAGNWEEVIDAYEPGDAADWFPAPPNVKCSPSSFWTELQGNSMKSTTGGPSYPHGSMIFIDPEIRDVVTGRFVLARLDETHEVTFKRLNNEGGRIYLEPLNTQYSIIEIADASQVIGTMLKALV